MYVAGYDEAHAARQAVIEFLGGGDGLDVRDAAAISEATVRSLRVARGQVAVL